MANYNHNSFENEFDRGNYARELRHYLQRNGNEFWWVSASIKTPDLFIQPKSYKEHLWESIPTVSRVSVQTDQNGDLSFGISGYPGFRMENTKNKFQERGYDYHIHRDKRGRKGRWWLTKKFNNLEAVANEFKIIEPLLFEKN